MPIDFQGEKWITQSEFSEIHGISLPAVSNYIKRKNVKSRYFPDVKRTLIKIGSLTLKHTLSKIQHPEDEIEALENLRNKRNETN